MPVFNSVNTSIQYCFKDLLFAYRKKLLSTRTSTCVQGHISTKFEVSMALRFCVHRRQVTDRQTDRRTDGRTDGQTGCNT